MDILSGPIWEFPTLYFYMFRKYVLWGMDKIDFDITVMDPERLRVEVFFRLGDLRESLGILYFEKAKRGFVNKPVGMNAWACVDAKVEGLYMKDESITPNMILEQCRKLIKEGGY